jgi:hypothetical protein
MTRAWIRLEGDLRQLDERTRTKHGQFADGGQVALRSVNDSLKDLEKFGGPPETRTPEPLIKSQLLYQLS